jgi:hypothetical protein
MTNKSEKQLKHTSKCHNKTGQAHQEVFAYYGAHEHYNRPEEPFFLKIVGHQT